MRILVALIAVFMVSGAVAEVDYDMNDVGFTNTDAKCQAHGVAPSGPVYVCKDPKTGKTQKVECQLSGNNNGDIHAQKMPKEMPFVELAEVCSLRSDNRF